MMKGLNSGTPLGVLPPYWPMRALWSAAAEEEFGLHLAIGAVVGALAIGVAATRFERRLLRRG